MIFLRHPTPLVAPGTCYGRTELEIHPDGEQEIVAALNTTPAVTTVRASPAKRCRKLAVLLAARHDLTPIWDERLLELDFGEWEGTPWTELVRSETKYWLSDPWNIAPPGGETFGSLHGRIAAAIADANAETALVCHSTPIRAARMILEGKTFRQAFADPVPFATPITIAPISGVVL